MSSHPPTYWNELGALQSERARVVQVVQTMRARLELPRLSRLDFEWALCALEQALALAEKDLKGEPP